MPADNYFIADQFAMLSKLMDIHGENSFKTKSYSIAAFTIEKLPEQLALIPPEKIFAIKGIGDAIGKKILGILETNQLNTLNEYMHKTPAGVIEMLNIKGLGPKKIATIWKEMEIESIGELLYACNENRLLLFKGFGEKTQKNVKDTIEFYLNHQGSYLFAQAEQYAMALDSKIKDAFPESGFELTGEMRRHSEIITQIEWVTTLSRDELSIYFESNGFQTAIDSPTTYSCKATDGVTLVFHCAPPDEFCVRLFQTSCSEHFLQAWKQADHWKPETKFESEEHIFSDAGIPFIPPFLREKASVIDRARVSGIADVITSKDIRAVIHSHSNWSDGSQTIEEMAEACIAKGYEYLVISDHSKSAFYANGLNEERIQAQHRHIDELNEKQKSFKIFKSIECDILNDGNLDYRDEVLASFDLVIASVHSNLKMTEEKAMIRLLRAIENPYTTILGHMTGRLLLSRPGYPVDHHKIIDACAANKVVIELNAHPRRLDMDWRWIDYALEKNVLISIDPDAHSTHGYEDIRYGVLAAQKAQVTAKNNLSSFSRTEFEEYLSFKKS